MTFKEEYYIKSKARMLAYKTIKIKDTDECVICGIIKKDSNKFIRHHDDYNKPLEVRFMCDICHGRYHSKGKGIYDRRIAILQQS